MQIISMDEQCHSRFLQQEEISELQNLSNDGEYGYILEVDLHYPTNLHNQHDDE